LPGGFVNAVPSPFQLTPECNHDQRFFLITIASVRTQSF
jgi:hypothetical protein